MAYTEYGGSLIFIEAAQSSFFKSKEGHGFPGLKITGSLGGVMKESMQIAYTFAKHFANEILKNNFLEKNEVHIHAPEGATPKDGPSAGITITSALLSLSLQKPLKQNIAMTGEISLRGKVMKIGGLKEKILAAKREKISEIIVPKANQEDVRMLAEYIKEGITFHYAENYIEIFKILFPDVHL